jgi:hypothetical protein
VVVFRNIRLALPAVLCLHTPARLFRRSHESASARGPISNRILSQRL